MQTAGKMTTPAFPLEGLNSIQRIQLAGPACSKICANKKVRGEEGEGWARRPRRSTLDGIARCSAHRERVAALRRRKYEQLSRTA